MNAPEALDSAGYPARRQRIPMTMRSCLTNRCRTAALAAAAMSFTGASLAAPQAWRTKIDAGLLAQPLTGSIEFMLFLTEQAELSAASSLASKREKGFFVHDALTSTALRTQGPLRATLAAMGVQHRPFWVANMIWVRGSRASLFALAQRSDVARVFANPAMHLAEPLPGAAQKSPGRRRNPEWNLALVNAPTVWKIGYAGQGTVVAGQDTGYQWDHPALKSHYRGWNGNRAEHDYNWHDAVHVGGGRCGADSPLPCDDHYHGTHTIGTLIGDDGRGNRIGMAPQAHWIGCRNMDRGIGSPATYSECYQWFIAPTRIDGTDADPDRAPDVINNSWSCTPDEGCTDPGVLVAVVRNVRAAGILSVNAAGNSGPDCGSINEPSAIYAQSWTVGATQADDTIASFSSRGPVTIDGRSRRKPDVAAPGEDIRSSVPGGAYIRLSGTSMAAPHAAGLAALLISARPELAGQVDILEELSEKSAKPLTSSQGCGGDAADRRPNSVYGWGRLDAAAAYHGISSASLRVTLFPASLTAAGARWRLDRGSWQRSENLLRGATVGTHLLSFTNITGWRKPADQTVTLHPYRGKSLEVRYTADTASPN
jgi:serine protease AprX